MAASNSEGITPLEYLARADQEMGAGNGREAARLLWKATEGTFVVLARRRGMSRVDSGDDSLLELARVLDMPGNRPGFYYRGKVAAGFMLKEHADSDALEDYEPGQSR